MKIKNLKYWACAILPFTACIPVANTGSQESVSAVLVQSQWLPARIATLAVGGKTHQVEVYSYSNWVDTWGGFAVLDNNGKLSVLTGDGRLTPKGPSRKVELRRWTVDSSGKRFYLLNEDNSGLAEFDVLGEVPTRQITSADLRKRGIPAGPGQLADFGVAATSKWVAFTVAAQLREIEDTAGFLEPMTVIMGSDPNSAVRLVGQVPITFLNERILLTLGQNEHRGDFYQVSTYEVSGKRLGSLSGVVTAGAAGEDVIVLRFMNTGDKRKTVVERWDTTLTNLKSSEVSSVLGNLDLTFETPVIRGFDSGG